MTRPNDPGCDSCEPGVPDRNHFYPGKILAARDFLAEQQYFNQKRWMLNRHLFGWGVVCGLEVRWDAAAGWLMVGEGLALDCCGREIQLRHPERLRVAPPNRKPGSEQKLVVCLEYRECRTEPVKDPLDPSCHGRDQTHHNRLRDSYEITLRPPGEVCMDAPGRPCYLDSIKGQPGEERPCRTMGMHEYLCGEVAARCPRCRGCECVVLAVLTVRYPVGRDGGPVQVDVPPQTDRPQAPPASAVRADRQAQAEGENRAAADPVAEQELPEHSLREARERAEEERRKERERIEQERREAQERAAREKAEREQAERKPPEWEDPDPCAEPPIPQVQVDACSERRLVYSNPLLYDLIECFHGDLPHVVGLGWAAAIKKGRRVSWKAFINLLVGKQIAVRFDRRMQGETLNPHTFVVSMRVVERGTGFWVWKQVPCRGIEHGQEDRPGLGRCDVAVFIPDQSWVEDELDGHNSEVAGGTEVEITLRGSLIMDEAGKALDGEYVGYRLPTGNGTQGGDFVDWFTVDARPPGEVGAARAARAETIEF